MHEVPAGTNPAILRGFLLGGMFVMKAPVLVAGVLALALAGCGTAGLSDSPGTSGSTGPAAGAPSGSADLSWPQFGPGQRLALRQGCRALHGRNFTRYNQCVAGNNGSQQALE